MQRDPRAYLWDMQRAAALIEEFVSGVGEDEYRSNAMVRSAVERQFEILGEALSQLARVDPELAASIPNGREIIAFRNMLIHGYAKIDDARVRAIATTNLPVLAVELARRLAQP